MDRLYLKVALGWLRNFLTGFGAILVQDGFWQQSQQAQFVGTLVVLSSLALSAYDKYRAKVHKAEALYTSPPATVIAGLPKVVVAKIASSPNAVPGMPARPMATDPSKI